MTSEAEAIKTNEFLRRRKLRLQQVREQSKDIAKKIRQRANVVQLRQVADIDAKKQKEYFECQEKLVKRLEVLYARGLENVGASHQSASELTQQDEVVKTDLSKLRGKEATAELRRQKQEKLDQQKKILDRKLQAREIANEISREKSSTVANKLLPKSSNLKTSDDTSQKEGGSSELATKESDINVEKISNATETVKTSDMATQWDMETIPHEWEPVVPALSLPTDKDTPENSEANVGSKVDKNKKLDLFALSKEMPTSLRGKQTHVMKEREPGRPSLNIVSEYLQNRKLRLRETELPSTKVKGSEDMQSLKQTILRTRSAKPEGSPYNVCQVLDEQIIPVPVWRAERNCQFCSHNIYYDTPIQSRQFKNVTNSQINQIFSSIRPARQAELLPSPVLRGTSPFKRSKVDPRIFKEPAIKVRNVSENPVHRKSSVLMYNHSTRDTKDLPYCGNDNLVVRDEQSEEDAYSQAMKEVSALGMKDNEQTRRIQDMRNKVAVTKQNVEKEYKDTMNFLNSLPKDKCSKVIKKAYMDEHRQQMQHNSRQQKMQQEYKKIEKECRKHNCMKNRNSKSPAKLDLDDNFESRDFQYSWMPVPESDGNLAIHAIPNTVKQGKSGNSVKFSTVDSYHEYRSRHKHTPPTKDTQDKQPSKKVVETVIIDKNTTDSSDSSSITSDSSSLVNMRIDTKKKHKNAKEINKNLSDAERIIIYKVLDSKTEKKTKRQTKLLNEIAKSFTCIEKVQRTVSEGDDEPPRKQHTKHVRSTSKSADNAVSLEQLHEGVYKMVEEQGDNLTSTYFNEADKVVDTHSENTQDIQSCPCKILNKSEQSDKGASVQGESTQHILPVPATDESQCHSASKDNTMKTCPLIQSSTVPSTSSFQTAANDKGHESQGGYIKLIDETGQEAGKFYLGSSRLLNNNAYEVVIQLRKRNGTPLDNKQNTDTVTHQDKWLGNEIKSNSYENNQPTSDVANNDVRTASDEDMHEVLGYRSDINKQSSTILPKSELTNKNALSDEINHMNDKNDIYHRQNNTEGNDDINLLQSTSENRDMCDKSVHTHLTEPPKVEQQVPRSATTTYTQTVSSSPIHRPVFFHMSSSTSTAYMSPPETILPKFLRHTRHTTEDEMYEPIQTIELTEKEYCAEYAGCTCKKCVLARKMKVSKINPPAYCSKNKYENKNNIPLRNTVNNLSELRHEPQNETEKYVACKTAITDKPKCRHIQHRHYRNQDAVKRHHHRNKRTSVESIRSTRTSSMRADIDIASRNRWKPTSTRRDKKACQTSLNPIIRDYVNKLLALNREGLKAVEVADQECSSVATPSSSIINIPFNVDERKTSLYSTISLEQIKNLLKRQIFEEQQSKNNIHTRSSFVYSTVNSKNNLKYSASRTSRKKPVHKVKSLNISKNLTNYNKTPEIKSKPVPNLSSVGNFNPSLPGSRAVKNSRSKSTPTPRQVLTAQLFSKFNDNESTAINSSGSEKNDEHLKNKSTTTIRTKSVSPTAAKGKSGSNRHCITHLPTHRATATDSTLDSESTRNIQGFQNTTDAAVSMSTQTTRNNDVNADTNFMKLAEDKLSNMEKIADLTEKCTKRLSNLAKVLQEVRKNKSLAYSQISSAESTDSQSDHKSDNPLVSPIQFDSKNVSQSTDTKSPDPIMDKEISDSNEISQLGYMSVLSDIPKPVFKIPESSIPQCPKSAGDKSDLSLHQHANTAEQLVKKPKPPPALSRISLKHGKEYIIPHELSTVIEVDSPMSMKLKNQSARNDSKDISNNSNKSSPKDNIRLENGKKGGTGKETTVNPDLLQTNQNIFGKFKFSSTESSDDSKFQMIDLKQFNEIMLEPFISIQEYAKQYNMEPPDEGSNLDDIQRDAINDDMSSLHSDGSLPDVIAELLKRNVITEPFKFDTASNINSTTISSESTVSMLALSKARRDRKRSNVIFQNKENIGETSDTLSISSNPDLENAFKKLGMGWASSTLKKTKERLALSSSSNTSSSSLSQFKMKSFSQEVPVLVTDSVSSVANVSRGIQNKNTVDNSKNAEQQTTLSNSMTVKEFLRNELAKKITFTHKSNVNDTQEEFISLFETKIPEEMKETSQVNRDERSMDSAPSGANRARTSTPVQLFKSMTYHSSSSSNVSNGLFSNADDLSSVKMTSNSIKNHSTSDKDDLTIPNFSLRTKKSSDCSKSDSR